MEKQLVVFALVALCACNASGPTATSSTVWRCDGGVSFSTRITAEGNAEVAAGGETYELPGVIAGSGTRYTNETVEFWERGGEAMLNGAEGGPYENCRR